MPSKQPLQKAKVQVAGQGKPLASILEPMQNVEAVPSATKVIFTVGPACQDVGMLKEMLRAGGTCARIDLTWGSVKFHRQSLKNLERAMTETKRLCAVMLDTLGREVFVRRDTEEGENGWPKHGDEVDIARGAKVTLTTDENATQTEACFPVNYKELPDMAVAGDQLYVGRYLVTGADAASLYLSVDEVSEDKTELHCTAHNEATLGGLLTVFHMERNEKGIENKQNQQPLFAPSDTESLTMLLKEFDVDFLSLSYTRTAQDVAEARRFLDGVGADACKVIAKLDAKSSLANFRGILNACDGVMISRGNLGLDCLPERVAVIQKNVTTSCNLLGKPCIITRIVDTMVNAPRPTRAEATDVANAVLDGADCVLLGAETLRGTDPPNACRTVVACLHAAEAEFQHSAHFEYLMREAMKAEVTGISVPGGPEETPESSAHGSSAALAAMGARSGSAKDLHGSTSSASLRRALNAMTENAPSSGPSSSLNLQGLDKSTRREHSSFLAKLEAIASSSVRAAEKVAAKLIVVFTDTGLTASLVAKYRPSVPILTLVVPRLVNENMHWKVLGRTVARQCQIIRGLVPMLAAPSPDGDRVLRDTIHAAAEQGLLGAGDHAVCVEKISGDYCIKMVTVDDSGKDLQQQNVLVNEASSKPMLATPI